MAFVPLGDRQPLRFLRSQIAEIAGDPALRLYGIGLALVHVWTFLWLRSINARSFLHKDSWPICWPLIPCEPQRVLSEAGLETLFYAYLAVALLVGVLFALRRVTAAWIGLCLVNLFAAFIILLDYRLRLNQHYMAFWVALTFLFLPSKRNALRVLIVLFYFWASLLKFNWEWLSGAALYRPVWFFTGQGVIVACAYVLVLEFVFSWGLLAKNPRIFWAAFAQFIVFHIFSWPVVGFFYPTLLFTLLTVFPLARFLKQPGPAHDESLFRALVTGRERAHVYALAAVFSAFQLAPRTLPGDHAITGEGRLLGLHMFDALVVCRAKVVTYDENGGTASYKVHPPLNARERCDPLVFHAFARSTCKKPSLKDLDLHVESRRRTDSEFRPVIDFQGFCSKAPSYNPFWHNDWILTD